MAARLHAYGQRRIFKVTDRLDGRTTVPEPLVAIRIVRVACLAWSRWHKTEVAGLYGFLVPRSGVVDASQRDVAGRCMLHWRRVVAHDRV